MSNGETILNGRYRLVAQQGSGGMAVIYKAVDQFLGRTVACKVLRPSLTSDPPFVARFRNEARSVANLSHPNIVTVHDVGNDGQTYYMVMEYVEGQDLKKIIRSEGLLSIDRTLDLAIQICAGIGFAHRAGIVHADVKPQNILVTKDFRVKVTDFGIAQALTDTQPTQRQDVVWGSPHYFAPEQARGEKPTPASDVYAIGIVIFEMLTGRLPYTGSSQQELAMAHLREPVPRVTDLNPSVPENLSKIVYKVMSKDPAARYRMADQLGHILSSYRDQSRSRTENSQPPVGVFPVEQPPSIPEPPLRPTSSRRPENLPEVSSQQLPPRGASEPMSRQNSAPTLRYGPAPVAPQPPQYHPRPNIQDFAVVPASGAAALGSRLRAFKPVVHSTGELSGSYIEPPRLCNRCAGRAGADRGLRSDPPVHSCLASVERRLGHLGLSSMLSRLSLLLFLLIGLGSGRVLAVQETLPTSGELYTPVTFTIPVDPTLYLNPFDNRDIEVIGIFQSPSGQQEVIPGFWMQPYRDTCAGSCYDLQPDGDPLWQIRFTPREAGIWNYTLQVRDNQSVVSSQNGQLSVEPSDQPGFIGKGKNGRYFQYADGQPYFPIGQNLNWSWDDIGGLERYDEWLRELSDNGGNYARLFIDVPWFISLEWQGPVGDYQQSQKAAAELDVILERAAAYDVHLQLVLLWHQALRTYNGPPVLLPEGVQRPNVSADWDDNPYNVLNGGILSGPSVFFFNDQAAELFHRRLRYITARWGFSPQIFAWEVIDRIDQTANYDPDVAGSWLQQTINYLRQIDPYGHLITAGSYTLDDALANNALLDFISAQFYQRRPIETTGDQVTSVLDVLGRYLEPQLAPVMLSDYSLNPWFEPTADDPEGIHFQNTLWATALSGASGGAASDWWDSYVIPQGLERYYAPLAAFTAGIDWPNLNLQPAQAALLTDDVTSYAPVRVQDFRRQFAVPVQDVVEHTITADGVFPDLSQVPSFLYGQVYNNYLSQAQRYRVAPPVDTYLEIGIRSVSTQADAQLTVHIDDVEAVSLNLRAGTRDTSVRVPLSAGEHLVVLDNMGEDWLELDYLEIGQQIAPARVLTLRDSQAGVMVAWLQHRGYTWDHASEPRTPLQAEYRLAGMPAGRYVAEIWDPLGGAVLGEELLNVADDGVLALKLLPLDRQLAIRAIRQPDATPTENPQPIPLATNTPRP